MGEASEANTAGMNYEGAPLPEEILTDILARLPAKSVGRFRCVSRAWCAMLSSAYFVDLHARRANRPGLPRLLLSPVGSSYDGHIYSWQPGGQVEKLMRYDLGEHVTVPLTKPCRGLILIWCTDNRGYFVCNPSTGAVLPLPDSKMPLKMSGQPSRTLYPHPRPCFMEVSYGLGYCATRKEYKVVRLFTNLEGEEGLDLDFPPPSCEVFVLDKPAYWRPAAEKPPLCFVKEERPAVFLESEGCLHFLCLDGGIITFNVTDETFGSLPSPPSFENVVPFLTELDGCLCVCYGEPNSEDPYHVCMLRDYKEVRWEKLCCIDRTAWPESERMLLRSLWIAPLGIYFSGDAQKILFGTGTCKVFAIDPDGGAPQILLVPDDTMIGSCEDGTIPELGSFEESLVSVGHTIEEMIFSSPTTKVWFNILKWLPTRSVLELSLVCRAWRAMIMTDCFIQSHAIHANLKRSPRIMFIRDATFGLYMDIEDCTDENVPQPSDNLRSLWIAPLGIYFSGDAQKILFGTGTCKVFAIDPDGGAPQILLVPDDTMIGSCEDGTIPELGSFEESLVSVGHTIEEMIFSSPTTKVWFNILKWLPTRSVLELSLVCRAWRAMIMTDCFIQSHAIHANLKRSPRIMFIRDATFGLYMDIEDCTDENVPQPSDNLVCSQPCHGLNVGSCGDFDFICNPVMSYYERVSFDDNNGTFFAGRIGLGYDLEINKHVVVHITYKDKNYETGHYKLQCKVRYVSDTKWYPVEPPPRPIADNPPTFVNGKIYWMTEPNLGPVSARCEIVAFDVKSEKFEVVLGPPCRHDSGRMTILQLEGVLCVSCSDLRVNTIDIWMMRDLGIWSVDYHIELQDFFSDHYSSENATPLAVDPKDGRILLNTGCLLGYYEPKTATIETIYAADMALLSPDYKFCPIICHESLVYPPARLF